MNCFLKSLRRRNVSLGAYALDFAITHFSKRLKISARGRREVTYPLRSPGLLQAFRMDKKYPKTHGKAEDLTVCRELIFQGSEFIKGLVACVDIKGRYILRGRLYEGREF